MGVVKEKWSRSGMEFVENRKRAEKGTRVYCERESGSRGRVTVA